MDSAQTRSLTGQLTLRIVAFLERGACRFNEIGRLPESPLAPILAKHLRRMVRDGLIERVVAQIGPPAVVRYELTQLGRSMVPAASAMIEWLDANRSLINDARDHFAAVPALSPAIA